MHFFLELHIETVSPLDEVVYSNSDLYHSRKFIEAGELLVLLVIRAVGEERGISALYVCYFCWLHSFDGLFEHKRD